MAVRAAVLVPILILTFVITLGFMYVYGFRRIGISSGTRLRSK
jgi:hypothetical protein